MPSKKSVIRPVVLAVSALFATGVYAQTVVSQGAFANLSITQSLQFVNTGTPVVVDFAGAQIKNLTGQFDPTQAGALSGVTTLNANSINNIDLVTGTAKLGNMTLGGALVVKNGIKNDGDIATKNIVTTGDVTVGGKAKVDGKLNVVGETTTAGIVNEGVFKANNTSIVDGVVSGVGINMEKPSEIMMGATNNEGIHSAIRFSPTGSAQLLGDFVVSSVGGAGFMGSKEGGNLKVMGKTTLEGATTVNNTLDVTGVTTLNGATTVNNTLNVNGATTIVGATNINTTGNAATTIGNAAAAATLVGNVVSAAGGDLGNSGLTLKNGEASLTVKNAQGNTHGLVVGESSTTLSGGTSSTNLTLNDSGATFSNAATGAPTRVTGVANGSSDFDAVNVRQFSAAVAGVAASANIPGLDTNKTTSVGVGLGSYMNSQALAFGGSYRFSDKGVLRASLATGLNTGGSKTTFGIGAGWSW